MRKLAALALSLALLPAVPATADSYGVTAWVVERTSATATSLTVRGGVGALGGEDAFAAVSSATVDRAGRFTDAEGALFAGLVPEDPRVTTPAGEVGCHDVPGGTGCVVRSLGGVLAFAVWWDDATFDRVVVVLRGRSKDVELSESPGWRLRRWTGTVRVVDDVDVVSAATPLGRGVGTFGYADSPGGPGGSVAMGKLPCMHAGYTSAGTGAARLLGGTEERLATCADWIPPAAAARGSTEWVLDGAGSGVSDTSARLVVVERPLR